MGSQPQAPRMTLPAQLVLGVFLRDPAREVYGSLVRSVTGLASGTVHPILARLEGLGWLASRWESIDAREAGRPARRYYRLTAEAAAREALEAARARTRDNRRGAVGR